jgi:hypothetical protein
MRHGEQAEEYSGGHDISFHRIASGASGFPCKPEITSRSTARKGADDEGTAEGLDHEGTKDTKGSRPSYVSPLLVQISDRMYIPATTPALIHASPGTWLRTVTFVSFVPSWFFFLRAEQ